MAKPPSEQKPTAPAEKGPATKTVTLLSHVKSGGKSHEPRARLTLPVAQADRLIEVGTAK